MELDYYIMRKDEVITYAEFSEDGTMLSFSPNIRNRELAPIQDQYQTSWLKEWWKERSVPLDQGHIDRMLKKRGYSLPSEYLVKNLGLSLTDYYWIKPIDSGLKWKDVNLFENEFSENLLEWESQGEENDEIPHYSPNSTLQGRIEKTWICAGKERYLVKGNRDYLSSESINEVIATKIHEMQGYKNYATYELIKISHKDYEYGCRSKLFTSQKKELVSAFALYTNEKKANGVSNYSHLMNICKKYGMDMEYVQSEMDYQIMTDFIMTGYDRHLNNIAFIRDADSLKFIGTAPIYDSGGAFFAGKPVPANEKELFKVETYGFASREEGLLALVKDPGVIDLTKLPPVSFIRDMYEKDPYQDSKRISAVTKWYEKKIDMCRQFQQGKNPFDKKKIYTR